MLPPSLREWLPEEHLAWFVLDAVAQFDLAGFYAAYRADGHGRAAHDPSMMLALLLYAYSVGERSSRVIERRCSEDIAFRVIAANQVPDHTTIARFRQRHQQALADLFGDVLALCAEAGLVRVGVIAVDGTKLHASASKFAARSYEQIVEEILAEAIATDAAEDEQFGGDRGDELPADLRNRQGRRGWLREAKQRLEERRASEARPIAKSRPERLLEAKRRLEEEHRTELQAHADYEAYRARGIRYDGGKLGRGPNAFTPPAAPTGSINLTDLDSRRIRPGSARPRNNGRPAQASRTRSTYSPGGARSRVHPSPVALDQPPVDAEHVARLLCVKRKRVHELARRPNDPLPCVRIGGAVRFALPQVEEWVTGQAPA